MIYSNKFINYLEEEFNKYADPVIAKSQQAYMRNKFDFHGLTAATRRKIQKPLLTKHVSISTIELQEITKILWHKNQREYQYCAQELIMQNIQQFKKDDINLFEFMIKNKSWWDTIDFLAPKIIGHFFQTQPKITEKTIEKWLTSNNIWLQRSCLLFQLKYKENLNVELLTHIINSLLGSKEFFINKAIGWILREYSKTNEKWVIKFVEKTELSSLSKKEALKFMERKLKKNKKY